MDGETGQLVWFETYSTAYNERVVAAACDQAGNLYVVGRAFRLDFYDLVAQKYLAESGDLAWTRFIASPEMLDDVGWDVAVDGQGRPVVCGMVGTTVADANVVTAALDPATGEEVWRATLPGAVYTLEVVGGWVEVAANDDVILGTRTWSNTTGFDLVLRRYAAEGGDEVWARRWNSGGTVADDPRAMLLDANGDVLMAGVSDGDYLVAKFSGATGAPLWQGSYAGPPDWYDTATCLAERPDGTVVASGFSDGLGTSWDVATVGFAPADGSPLWSVRFDGYGESDEARGLASGPTGDVFVTGYCYSYDTSMDLLVLRYAGEEPTPAPGAAVPAMAGITSVRPNPFNPRVTLSYALPRDGAVRLAVCDLRGLEVAVIAEGPRTAGEHRAIWDGRDRTGRALPSGVYVAVLRTDDGRSTRKLLLAR